MSNFNADELKRKLRDVTNEPKVDRRVGVYFLRTAEDKSAAADLGALHEYAAHLPGVQMVRTLTVKAALDPEVLARELRKEKLNTVVLAAEHPGFYQPAFSRALGFGGCGWLTGQPGFLWRARRWRFGKARQ